MTLKSMITIAATIFVAAVPGLALTQGSVSYQCSYGDLQRRVEIHTEPGVSVPCEVHYYKDTEAPGEKQVLWSAASDAAYCETKTTEFIGKLLGWGWTCGQSDAAGSESESDVRPAAEPEAAAIPVETADEPPFVEDLEQGEKR